MPAGSAATGVEIAGIPKVELHCHLDGILDAEILAEMHDAGIARDVSLDELRDATPVRSYDEFIHWGRMHDMRIEGDIDNFRIGSARHIARLRAQRVVYAEMMIGSSEIPGDGGMMIDKLQAFRAFVDACEEGETQVEFLVTLNRKKPPAFIDEVATRAMALHRAGLIVGVAVAGIEQGNPVEPFARTLARLRDAGLGIEIHAGEWMGGGSIVDALDHGRPHRIGHAVAAFAEPSLLERVRDGNVHVELCPTSNVCTGAVPSMRQHPLAAARAAGIGFSINSDDPGPFGCDVAGEYRLAATEFGYSRDDLLSVSHAALAARFQPKLRGWAAEFAAGEDERRCNAGGASATNDV
jgi:adenosine deaminase